MGGKGTCRVEWLVQGCTAAKGQRHDSTLDSLTLNLTQSLAHLTAPTKIKGLTVLNHAGQDHALQLSRQVPGILHFFPQFRVFSKYFLLHLLTVCAHELMSSLLPPRGFRGSSSGCQAWWQTHCLLSHLTVFLLHSSFPVDFVEACW